MTVFNDSSDQATQLLRLIILLFFFPPQDREEEEDSGCEERSGWISMHDLICLTIQILPSEIRRDGLLKGMHRTDVHYPVSGG